MNIVVSALDRWPCRWELKVPQRAVVKPQLDGSYVACLDKARLYGYGKTPFDAADDLKDAMVNQYEFLLKELAAGRKLGSVLGKQLSYLGAILSHAKKPKRSKA